MTTIKKESDTSSHSGMDSMMTNWIKEEVAVQSSSNMLMDTTSSLPVARSSHSFRDDYGVQNRKSADYASSTMIVNDVGSDQLQPSLNSSSSQFKSKGNLTQDFDARFTHIGNLPSSNNANNNQPVTTTPNNNGTSIYATTPQEDAAVSYKTTSQPNGSYPANFLQPVVPPPPQSFGAASLTSSNGMNTSASTPSPFLNPLNNNIKPFPSATASAVPPVTQNTPNHSNNPTVSKHIKATATTSSGGRDGFVMTRPFPYKNSQGDICCVVCCLQKGQLFFQAPCHFKIFRERGAIINDEREEWVLKVFGYDGLRDGRMCDKHYREMLKIKNGKGFGRKRKSELDGLEIETPTDSSREPKTSALFNLLVKEMEELVEDTKHQIKSTSSPSTCTFPPSQRFSLIKTSSSESEEEDELMVPVRNSKRRMHVKQQSVDQ